MRMYRGPVGDGGTKIRSRFKREMASKLNKDEFDSAG